jgi:hypothetical protein
VVSCSYCLLFGGPESYLIQQSSFRGEHYTFVKNGVQYQAKCFATGRPVLGHSPNDPPDTSPGAMPPDLSYDETNCSDILLYLHKPVPHLEQYGGSLLLFTEVEKRNYKLEFEIKHAE